MDFEKIMEKVSAIIGEERAQTIMELGFKAGMEISDQLPSAVEGRSTEDLMDIHEIAEKELGAQIDLEPVTLKFPVPVRPKRALGLVTVDAKVFSSEQLSRFVLLKIDLPSFVSIRSMFIRPFMEYDLPVFAAEVVKIGQKRMAIIDIHRTGADTGHDDEALFDRMEEVKDKYTELCAYEITQKGEIQSVFSRAACQVWITSDLDDEALALFREYLQIFIDLVKQTKPLTGDKLEKTKEAYEKYLELLVDHDPGVKGFKVLFGDEEGVARSMNMHFDR